MERTNWFDTLIDALRQAHFVVTIDHYRRMLTVLFHHFSETPDIENTAQLKAAKELLAPIVCTSASQQELFYQAFDQSIRRMKSREQEQKTRLLEKQEQQKHLARLQWQAFAYLLALCLTVALFFLTYDKATNSNAIGTPVVAPDTLKADDPLPKPQYAPKYDSLAPAPRNETAATLDIWKIVLLGIFFGTLSGAIIYRLVYYKSKKVSHAGPPVQLRFPSQEEDIHSSDAFDSVMFRLQQREESERKVLNIKRSVTLTVKRGGFPVVAFQGITHQPHYLILIESRSTYNQYARSLAFFSKLLYKSGLNIDVFFFNGSPHYCWNSKFSRGIQTASLYKTYASSFLLLVTRGEQVIDYEAGDEKNMLAPWFVKLFQPWQKKALVTPAPVSDWALPEKVLSGFMPVVPATTSGLSMAKEFMTRGETPSFEELRSLFSKTGNAQETITKKASDLTVSDIERFFEQEMEGEAMAEDLRLQVMKWAFATVVYGRPSFDVTVAIGKAIAQKRDLPGLVNAPHLLLVTSMPWLQHEELPPTLKDNILIRLNNLDAGLTPADKTEQIAREAVMDLLMKTDPPKGSRAFEEKEIRYWEQALFSRQHSTWKATHKLRTYQKAGLIDDAMLNRKISGWYLRWKTMLLAVVIMFLTGFTYIATDKSTTNIDASGLSLYSMKDSAAFYNDEAVRTMKEALDDSLAFKEKYPEAMRLLLRSLDYRRDNRLTAALENLFRLRFNSEVWSRTIIESSRIPLIMRPVSQVFPGYVPSEDNLVRYLQFLEEESAGDNSFLPFITTLHASEYNRYTPLIEMGRDLRRSLDTAVFMVVDMIIPFSFDPYGVDAFEISFTPSELRKIREVRRRTLAREIHLYYGGPRAPVISAIRNAQRPDTVRSGYSDNKVRQVRLAIERLRDSLMRARMDSLQAYDRYIRWKEDSIRRADSLNNISEPVLNADSVAWVQKYPQWLKQGSIPGAYGLLYGELDDISLDKTFLYLYVTAGKKYRAAISINPEPDNYAIVRQSFTLPRAFSNLRKMREGFIRLNKEANTGALNYLAELAFVEAKTISVDTLTNYFLQNRLGEIYIWGGLEGNEMRDIHMNQGSRLPDYLEQNAPWQDGAIVYLPKSGKPFVLYVHFSTQTSIVNSLGQPLRPWKSSFDTK